MSLVHKCLFPVKAVVGDLHHLILSDAPLNVCLAYLYGKLRWQERKTHHAAREAFRAVLKAGSFTNDWFTTNIPHWLCAFQRYQLTTRPLRALEVGSWEGASSLFILQQLPKSTLLCVDTWAGADEHQGLAVLSSIEANFDQNLTPVRERLTKYKGRSDSFFHDLPAATQYDFIYIDGSHYADDVLHDALHAFSHLTPGGIIIFDDFLWRQYRRRNDNPAAALCAFLRMKKGQYRIVAAYYQLILEKTAESKSAIHP